MEPNLYCSEELMGIYTSVFVRKYCIPISSFFYDNISEKENITNFFSWHPLFNLKIFLINLFSAFTKYST